MDSSTGTVSCREGGGQTTDNKRQKLPWWNGLVETATSSVPTEDHLVPAT